MWLGWIALARWSRGLCPGWVEPLSVFLREVEWRRWLDIYTLDLAWVKNRLAIVCCFLQDKSRIATTWHQRYAWQYHYASLYMYCISTPSVVSRQLSESFFVSLHISSYLYLCIVHCISAHPCITLRISASFIVSIPLLSLHISFYLCISSSSIVLVHLYSFYCTLHH